MARLTRDEVVAVIGRADDLTVAEIIATGAGRAELAEAYAWRAADEDMMNRGKPLPAGTVGRIVEILAAADEPPDEP